ncbi:hypothetical protein NDA18_001938 [Ustilago nuda]|nr:hypothetical protein NDA18_001938 [Ustilago nuda]
MSQMVTLEQATWAWIEAGPRKHHMPVGKRFAKGIMAGFCKSSPPTHGSPPTPPGLLKIFQGAVFPVGLVMIVLLQADLVTGEMAIFIMSTVKRRVPYWGFLYGWTITFIGNLIGSLLYAGLLVHFSEIYTPAMQRGAAMGADAKVSTINFRELWLRAIGCNVLVGIAVFQASLAKDVVSKVVASWFPIFVFVAAGFKHVFSQCGVDVQENELWGGGVCVEERDCEFLGEGASVGMVKGGAVSPGGMSVNEVTLPGSGTVSARGNDKLGKDIEAQTPA